MCSEVLNEGDVLHWSATLEKLALNIKKEDENKTEAAKAAAPAKRKDDKDKAAADKLADIADKPPGASLKNTKREAEKGIAGMEEQVNDAVQVQQVTVEQAEVQVKAAAERLRVSSERRKEAVCAQLRMLAPLITRIEKHVSPAVREAVDYDRVLYLCARVPALSDDKLASIARIDNVHDSEDDSDTGISSDEEQQDAAGRGLLPPRQDRKPIRGAKEARELSIEELGYVLVSHGKAKQVSTRLRGRPVLLEYR